MSGEMAAASSSRKLLRTLICWWRDNLYSNVIIWQKLQIAEMRVFVTYVLLIKLTLAALIIRPCCEACGPKHGVACLMAGAELRYDFVALGVSLIRPGASGDRDTRTSRRRWRRENEHGENLPVIAAFFILQKLKHIIMGNDWARYIFAGKSRVSSSNILINANLRRRRIKCSISDSLRRARHDHQRAAWPQRAASWRSMA